LAVWPRAPYALEPPEGLARLAWVNRERGPKSKARLKDGVSGVCAALLSGDDELKPTDRSAGKLRPRQETP
jgi:hypothetical protein